MRDLIIRSLVLLVTITMIAAIVVNTNNSSAMNVNTDNNPLLAKWEGPYGGVPPFDRVQIPLFKPALEAGMAEISRRSSVLRTTPRHPALKTRSSRWNVPASRLTASRRSTEFGARR